MSAGVFMVGEPVRKFLAAFLILANVSFLNMAADNVPVCAIAGMPTDVLAIPLSDWGILAGFSFGAPIGIWS